MAERSELAPLESWLAALVDRAMAGCPDIEARIARLDMWAPSKLGEVRAYVALRRPAAADRQTWKRLGECLTQDPAIERAVPVPPTIHVTLAPGVLEAGLVRCAGQEPLLPRRSEAPGAVVVFCSPNTNKPLHIGHLRACFLGMSISRLLEATGIDVARSQMLSNFGIHMCKALAMYDGVSEPGLAGAKGDHFVGDLYRAHHQAIAVAGESNCDDVTCRAQDNGQPCVRCRASHLLRRMARNDRDALEANRRLGEWAIQGILDTQARVGTIHDTCIRESGVIALAVDALEEAVESGVCKRRPDGSTYIRVRSTGQTELTLLRRDGTSLVSSMLLGIYLARGAMYPGWQVLELTGEQWRTGRTAMYEVLRRIGREDLAAHTEGVFFGMVRLDGAVMQSRSGFVVDADTLLDRTAERVTTWEALPEAVRREASSRDTAAANLIKFHVLRFPRSAGFDFDEEAMWHDGTARLGAVMRVLAWAERGEASPGPAVCGGGEARLLALLLGRQAAVADRALAKRDPAIVVRYVDDVAKRASAMARSGGLPPDLATALSWVLRRSLRLLDIDAVDLVGPSEARDQATVPRSTGG